MADAKARTVDEFVAGMESWQAEVASALRRIVREAAPEATEAIKWGQPVFDAHGPIAWFRPARNHVTFGFWRGIELTDPEGLLEGDGDRMRHVKIRGLSDLREERLKAWLREAVRLNREKGSPTRRGGSPA